MLLTIDPHYDNDYQQNYISFEIYQRIFVVFIFNKEDGMFGISTRIGHLLLAIFLILTGLNILIGNLGIPNVVMGLLALVAGIFIFIGR